LFCIARITPPEITLGVPESGVQAEILMRNKPLFTNGHPGVKLDTAVCESRPQFACFHAVAAAAKLASELLWCVPKANT
jgi:hypothetical protein